jgi:DNA-binding PadR family transcriptional regulator
MPKIDSHRFLPLKTQWFHILLALAGGEENDYRITQEVLAQSGASEGPWSAIVHRSVSSAIKRLVAAGLIEESHSQTPLEPRDSHRRNYQLTDFGRQVLEAECERLDELVRAVRMKQAKVAQ